MTIASTMTAYITSNFITGESLEENVRIEATIVGVREHDFEGDVKPTVDLDDGRRIQLNQERLKALIGGFGPNPANWIGRPIVVSRGTTTYGGKRVACVVVKPVVPTRIGADPKPAIAAQPDAQGLDYHRVQPERAGRVAARASAAARLLRRSRRRNPVLGKRNACGPLGYDSGGPQFRSSAGKDDRAGK